MTRTRPFPFAVTAAVAAAAVVLTLLPLARRSMTPGVKAAAGNLQDVAHELHGKLPSMLLDEGKPQWLWLAK